MAEGKQTLYEILGVSQYATLDEIKAAHRAKTRALVSDQTGLTREEIQFRLQVLDMALATLSAPSSRDIYDTELGARTASRALVVKSPPAKSAPYNAVVVAEALHESYKTALAGTETSSSLAVFAESAANSAAALKKIFRVLLWLFGLFIVFKMSAGIFLATHHPVQYAKEKARAEDMVIVQDYYEKNGVRLASRAEVEMVEQEAARKQDEAARAQAAQERAQERENQFSNIARSEGDSITAQMQVAAAQKQLEEQRQQREEAWHQQQLTQQRMGPLVTPPDPNYYPPAYQRPGTSSYPPDDPPPQYDDSDGDAQ